MLARCTQAVLAACAIVFTLSAALNAHSMVHSAVQPPHYALALSSGPELQLSERGNNLSPSMGAGRRLVCSTVLDVFVAKIGTHCAADRRHAAVTQR